MGHDMRAFDGEAEALEIASSTWGLSLIPKRARHNLFHASRILKRFCFPQSRSGVLLILLRSIWHAMARTRNIQKHPIPSLLVAQNRNSSPFGSKPRSQLGQRQSGCQLREHSRSVFINPPSSSVPELG